MTMATVVLAATSLVGCAPGDADIEAPSGAPPGKLVVVIADKPDGTSERQYLLELPGGEYVPAGEPPVTGYGAAQPSALLAETPHAPQSFAFVLIDTGAGVNLTATQAKQQMFDAGYFAANHGSIRRYYNETSFGLQDITGNVVGPIAYVPGSSCDINVAAMLRPQVDAMLGVRSDIYLWYFGSRQSGCGWTGLASLGSPATPTRDTWFNASSSCVVLAQEPGHNFGMQHSSSMKCGSQSFVDVPAGACTHSEYGDSFDVMGSGCRHLNGWQKQYQGWLGGCNAVKVTASGNFTLLPLEAACKGIQVLQIPMPHARTFSFSGGGNAATTDELTSYFIELRAQASGFDQTLAPQVQVRVGGDYRPRSQAGLHTWLLDMKPGTATFNDAAMAVGQTFTDPAGGVSFTATAVDAGSATIAIEIAAGSGAPVCLDGTTLAPPGPPTCAGTGLGGTTGSGGTAGAAGAAGATSTGGSIGAGGAPGGGAGGAVPAGGSGGDIAPDAGDIPGQSSPSGCDCAVAQPPGAQGLAPLAIAVAWAWRRRRSRHGLGRWISIAALACMLGLAACANGEVAGSGAGGATGAAGSTGAAGTTGVAGATGASGSRGASGTSGAGGGGGRGGGGGAPTADAGAAGSAGADAGAATWSCVEVADALCFCNQGNGDAPRCALTWTCCFAGTTSCQCLNEDEATCTATIGMNAMLRRVPACPP